MNLDQSKLPSYMTRYRKTQGCFQSFTSGQNWNYFKYSKNRIHRSILSQRGSKWMSDYLLDACRRLQICSSWTYALRFILHSYWKIIKSRNIKAESISILVSRVRRKSEMISKRFLFGINNYPKPKNSHCLWILVLLCKFKF